MRLGGDLAWVSSHFIETWTRKSLRCTVRQIISAWWSAWAGAPTSPYRQMLHINTVDTWWVGTTLLRSLCNAPAHTHVHVHKHTRTLAHIHTYTLTHARAQKHTHYHSYTFNIRTYTYKVEGIARTYIKSPNIPQSSPQCPGYYYTIAQTSKACYSKLQLLLYTYADYSNVVFIMIDTRQRIQLLHSWLLQLGAWSRMMM